MALLLTPRVVALLATSQRSIEVLPGHGVAATVRAAILDRNRRTTTTAKVDAGARTPGC